MNKRSLKKYKRRKKEFKGEKVEVKIAIKTSHKMAEIKTEIGQKLQGTMRTN